MEEKLLNWEDGTYRLVFDPEGRGGTTIPAEVFRVEKGGKEVPVDGRLWATILFEGYPSVKGQFTAVYTALAGE